MPLIANVTRQSQNETTKPHHQIHSFRLQETKIISCYQKILEKSCSFLIQLTILSKVFSFVGNRFDWKDNKIYKAFDSYDRNIDYINVKHRAREF